MSVDGRARRKSFADMRRDISKQAMNGNGAAVVNMSVKSPIGWRRDAVRKSAVDGVPVDGQIKLQHMYKYIQNRMYLLSAVLGDLTKPFNRYKGVVGLIIWILNLACHFALDFYEARFVFHVSWASSIGLYFVMFVVGTIFIIKNTIPWYVKTVRKLSREEIYEPTLRTLRTVFKYFPYVMFALSTSGAGAQFGCYAYDGALKLSFGTTSIRSQNNTVVSKENNVPSEVELVFNILRFTSLVHIYYAMFYFLLLNLVVFFTVVHSQKSFNAHMGTELKRHPPLISFEEAVNKFSDRTKLLQGASSNTTIVLSTLLLATSISFVVNAYNFLFIERFAIYVWFAVAPLLWTVAPMIGGAWVTSQYQMYKHIVIQSWVEIPEKYDEIWSRENDVSPNSNRNSVLLSMRRKSSLNQSQSREDTNVQSETIENRYTESGQDTKASCDGHVSETKLSPRRSILDEKNDQIGNQNYVIQIESNENFAMRNGIRQCASNTRKDTAPGVTAMKDIPEEDLPTVDNLNIPLSPVKDSQTGDICAPDMKQTSPNQPKRRKSLGDILSRSTQKRNTSASRKRSVMQKLFKSDASTEQAGKKQKLSVNSSENEPSAKKVSSFSSVVNVARTVKKIKPTRKFNYEKYIKFLELTLDTVGFSLGKVTITWDRVSFFVVLLLTLVGVFAQNAFLK